MKPVSPVRISSRLIRRSPWICVARYPCSSLSPHGPDVLSHPVHIININPIYSLVIFILIFLLKYFPGVYLVGYIIVCIRINASPSSLGTPDIIILS